MTPGAAFRGQPLLLLIGLLLGWLLLRAVIWPRAFEQIPQSMLGENLLSATGPVRDRSQTPGQAADGATMPSVWSGARLFSASLAPRPAVSNEGPRLAFGVRSGAQLADVSPVAAIEAKDAYPAEPAETMRPLFAPASPDPDGSRWSADGWLLFRRDSVRSIGGAGTPGYGRSQAGAVLRYHLAPASALRPQAYLRASSALSAPAEPEIAAGISARPVAKVPLRLAAEVRGSDTAVRPAVYAVTELPPVELPYGAQAEVYVQVGYVGGRFATAFADGQARIEGPVARFGSAVMSVGAGTWGGAQEGAERLDVGPTMALRFPVGPAYARLAADYRFRVAGDASPDSGPALTLSAGF